MTPTISKILLFTALGPSLALSIPSVSVYTQPDGIAIEAEITSYNSEPDQTDETPFITASGTRVHDGTIACPHRYRFGTRVLIGVKEYVCEDRMNERYPDRFDIWMGSKEESIEWGVRKLKIIIS